MLVQKIRATALVLTAALLVAGGLSTYRPGRSGAAAAQPDDRGPMPAREVPVRARPARPFTLDEVTGAMLRDLGNQFDVDLVGRADGVVSGTELYFYDSNLDAAAVHAGLVKPGEKAIITVTVVKCPPSSAGSTRHGVKSQRWDAARPTDTALLLQRRPGPIAESPRLQNPTATAATGAPPVPSKTKYLSLDDAVREKLNQTATVEFRVASATMAWTTGFRAEESWMIQLTPTVGLSDGNEMQICLTSKAVSHLRNLGLVNEHGKAPADFIRGKVVRLVGKVEGWEDREKKGRMIYRICVSDLDNIVISQFQE
jgi:hypothetical protein